jgi:hypothetical protein
MEYAAGPNRIENELITLIFQLQILFGEKYDCQFNSSVISEQQGE